MSDLITISKTAWNELCTAKKVAWNELCTAREELGVVKEQLVSITFLLPFSFQVKN